MTMGIASASPRDTASRIDATGWGLLFLMTGLVLLVPSLPNGTWLIGLGAILLAANTARVAAGLAAQWFGVLVGAGAVVAGAGTIAGIDVPVVALLFIACGAAVIVGQYRHGEVRA